MFFAVLYSKLHGTVQWAWRTGRLGWLLCLANSRNWLTFQPGEQQGLADCWVWRRVGLGWLLCLAKSRDWLTAVWRVWWRLGTSWWRLGTCWLLSIAEGRGWLTDEPENVWLVIVMTLAESRYWLTGEAADKDGLPGGDEDWLTTELCMRAEISLSVS